MLITSVVVLSLIVAIAVMIGIVIASDSIVVWLAQKDTLWSPYRVKAPSGQMLVMAKSKSNGEFSAIYPSIKGKVVDDNHDIVEGKAKPSYTEEMLGVVWVGFFKKFYLSPVEYLSVDKETEKGKTKFTIVDKSRNKSSDDPFYYYQYIMAAVAEGVEIQDNVKIDMAFLFTVRLVNPYKALFLAGKFPVRATTAVEEKAKEFVRDLTFEQVRQKQQDDSENGIREAIYKANKELRESFGLEIADLEYWKFDLTPGSPEVAKALEQLAVNKHNAEAAVAKAEEIRTLAGAEADKIRLRYQALAGMPGAAQFALADAIREAEPTTVVLGQAAIAVPPT